MQTFITKGKQILILAGAYWITLVVITALAKVSYKVITQIWSLL
jgi:hypothetical protein